MQRISKIEYVPIWKVKNNPNNPRLVKDDKFKKLVKSISEFPDMLDKRPIIVNSDMIVLGGNMRLKACNEAGLKEVPIIVAQDWTEEQQRAFIIKDNLGYGEWDWDALANEWDADKLDEWGLDVPIFKEHEEIEPSGYDLTQKWFLNIEFEKEQDCEKWYNSLIEEGLICKIVQ